MLSMAERARDASFQRVADNVDARFGINCFALSRVLGNVAVAGILGCGLVALDLQSSDADVSGPIFLFEALSVCIALKGLGACLAEFEARAPSSRARCVIPLLRDPALALLGFAMMASSLASWGVAACFVGQDVALEVMRHGSGTRLCGLIALLCACLLPPAFLFAQCEDKRLFRRSETRDTRWAQA